MGRGKKVAVPFAFGRRDRVDPKHAPFGVLKVGTNLRVRKDGRLGVRHGYAKLDMSTANGELYAYDLHEYRGRLLALGSDGGDGYPTDLFEYTGRTNEAWRGTDTVGRRVTLNPFSNLREVAGLPQIDDDIDYLDAAAGDGMVCLVYDNLDTFAVVVDQDNDQVVHVQSLGALIGGAVFGVCVVFSDGVFYAGCYTLVPDSRIIVMKFDPGADSGWSSFATVATGAIAISDFDMCPVTHPSTARVAVAVTREPGDTVVQVFNAAAMQVGSTVTVAGNDAVCVSVDADQTDGTINILTCEAASAVKLRTYNFSGALLDGPTTCTSGSTGYLCRLPGQFPYSEHVAVIVNDASANSVIQFWDVDAHTLTGTTTINRAFCRSRPVSGQSATQPRAVVFAALIGGDLVDFEDASNALFFVTPDVAHMTTRDLRTGRPQDSTIRTQLGLTRDPSNGRLCWLALRDPGVDLRMPVVTLLDFQSTARRQSAKYGGLLYFAGATPSVYDGRIQTELNFNEFPWVLSATPSTSPGSDLASEATYSYIVAWEYVFSDGSVELGPHSDPLSVSTGVGENRVTLVVTGPHTLRAAMGDALYGADVTVVIYRTSWEPIGKTENSIFRRILTRRLGVGMANYGRTLTINDGTTDVGFEIREALYTQSDRGAATGPLAHFAPSSCAYITATESRLLLAGLPNEQQVQVSFAAFPGEAFSFSSKSEFFTLASAPVLGVRSLDSAKLIFTTDKVLTVNGDGPDDIGVGVLSPPVEIPSPSGLESAWSFLDGPEGLWFQLDDDKLFRIPRGGGAPTWEGIDIEDTLQDFPDIVGAAKHKRDNTAVFACTVDAFSGVQPARVRFLVRDFRTEAWFEDTPPLGSDSPPGGHGVDVITGHGDSVAYVSFGSVLVQSATEYGDTQFDVFVNTQARTHPLYPFTLGGYGQIYECLLTGEYRGDCVLRLSVSYDDGLTFTTLSSFDLNDDDGLVQGQTIQRKWTMPQDITSSVVLDFTVTSATGTANEGFVFNQVDLLVEAEDGLRELKPDEMA